MEERPSATWCANCLQQTNKENYWCSNFYSSTVKSSSADTAYISNHFRVSPYGSRLDLEKFGQFKHDTPNYSKCQEITDKSGVTCIMFDLAKFWCSQYNGTPCRVLQEKHRRLLTNEGCITDDQLCYPLSIKKGFFGLSSWYFIQGKALPQVKQILKVTLSNNIFTSEGRDVL